MSVLDDLMPRFDARKRYERPVGASPAAIWQALQTYDLAADSSVITRMLLRLRGLKPRPGAGVAAFAGSSPVLETTKSAPCA